MVRRSVGALIRLTTSGRSKHWPVQFLQHVITGGAAVAAHYSVMWVALHFDLQPAVATTIGFVFGATTRFLLSYFHVFDPTREVVVAIPLFLLVLAAQMVLNAVFLTGFLSVNLPVWPSQILATGLLAVFNFLAYKFWVFR